MQGKARHISSVVMHAVVHVVKKAWCFLNKKPMFCLVKSEWESGRLEINTVRSTIT